MSTPPPTYSFFTKLARTINSGQSRSVVVEGNVQDLYFATNSSHADGGRYLPLVDFLCEKWSVEGVILLVYEINGPVRVITPGGREKLRRGWLGWRTGLGADRLAFTSLARGKHKSERERIETEFDRNFLQSVGKPTLALEFLRQLSVCSRSRNPDGRRHIDADLLVIVEAADLLLPAGDGDISHLSAVDRQRVSIVHDWFCDPDFLGGRDTVVLLSESASSLHPRITSLPQVVPIEAPAPDERARRHYVDWLLDSQSASPDEKPQLAGDPGELARLTAGLSIHALRQLLVGASYTGDPLDSSSVIERVEEFIRRQLGEDVVEFKKPTHTLDDVVGFSRLKQFLRDEMVPRLQAPGPEALPGAAVAGPIGGGKTFVFEALAGALDLPVLVLKNVRSQWFGQTDVIFERLRRVLEALSKVVILVDEADTQFGAIGTEAHPTERRLTAKIQQMMSDPQLRGRVFWLLLTARIHLLSPDIRRPGRVGDLIIPVLDPEGEDRREFLRWTLDGVVTGDEQGVALTDDSLARLDALTEGYSAAAFASLRSRLRAEAVGGPVSLDDVERIVHDHLAPPIERTRRYQTLQALVNCTRRSLLPDPAVTAAERRAWEEELRALEAEGIR